MHLQWWGWLVVCLTSATICAIAIAISSKREGNSCFATFCVVGGGLTATFTFFIAVIRFVKWAWAR